MIHTATDPRHNQPVRLSRRHTLGLLGGVVALGALSSTPAAYANSTRSTGTTQPAVAKAPTGTPQLVFSPQVWASGKRVRITATRMTPGQQVTFMLYGMRGDHATWSTTYTAKANSRGLALVIVTWPAAKVSKAFTHYSLYAYDQAERFAMSNIVSRNGRWESNAPAPVFDVTFSASRWTGGSELAMTARGMAPGKLVRFELGAQTSSDTIMRVGLWTAVANSAGVATVTTAWPAEPEILRSTPPLRYGIMASDPTDFSIYTELVVKDNTWYSKGTPPVAQVRFVPPAWANGSDVAVAASGLLPGKPVKFTLIAWRGTSGMPVASPWTVNAGQYGDANVTIKWPAADPSIDTYSLNAIDGEGNSIASWSKFSNGTWTPATGA